MLVVASVLWSISGVAVKKLRLPPITFTLYRSVGAALAMVVLLTNLGAVAVLLPMALAGHVATAPAGKVGVVLAVGVVQLAVPYALFQFALRRVTPVDASLLTLLEPVLNPVWVALLTPERP